MIEVASYLELREWANSCVERYKQNEPAPTPYKLLGTFKSATSKSVYKVHSRGDLLTCSCPGYTFRRKCKHLNMV